MSLRDVQRLQTFALVVDLGSISAAAGILGYTQSAVSQQLATLEREVGAPLVDRSQRPLRPTAAGAMLRPHVERVLGAIGGVDAALDDIRGGTPRLRLAAFGSALSSFAPAAVRDLRRSHPDVVIEIVQFETQEAIECLRAGAAEMALVHYMPGIAIPETAGLKRRHLLLDHLYVIVPKQHRLAGRAEIGIADLDGEPLILPRRGTPAGRFRSVVEHLCGQTGFAPRIAYEFENLPAMQAFVAAGIALVPMHGLTLTTVPADAVVRPLAERPAGSRAVEVLVPAGTPNPVADDLTERLVAAARAYAATEDEEGPALRSLLSNRV